MGAFKSDFIEGGSPRGLSVDLMRTINPKWRVGGGITYQDFYQKTPRALYGMQDGATLSAVTSNSLQNTTLLAKGMFIPVPENRLKPFISAGVGLNMAQVNQALGMFDNINDVNFGFAAQGGGGVMLGLGAQQRTHLTAGANYNFLPFSKHGIGGLSNLSFGIGARFTLKQNTDRGGRVNDGWDRGRRPPRHYGW
jgi:hypothetical protein